MIPTVILAPVKPRDALTLPSAADLQLIFAMLNARHFGGVLRSYTITFNPRLSSVAGRIGHSPPVIELSPKLLAAHAEQVTPTLLHEMVHAWLHQHGLPSGHGREFKRKMREVGLTSIYHFLPVKRRRSSRRYLLLCPRCQNKLVRRRRPGFRVSCARCSPHRFNPNVEMLVNVIA
jgi:predicted SprT family Zn-dependent metalloprotease